MEYIIKTSQLFTLAWCLRHVYSVCLGKCLACVPTFAYGSWFWSHFKCRSC